MHFKDFQALFEAMLVLKKQYPILFSYHAYLKTLDEQGREKEMNAFVLWLGSNPRLGAKLLDNPKFVSPAKGKTIFFDAVFKLADAALAASLWKMLQGMCRWVDENPSVNLVFNKLQHNAMVKELIADLDLDGVLNGVAIDNLQVDDIDDILFSPQLMPTLSKLKTVVATGKYDYKKFLPLIKSTIHDLRKSDEIEAGSKETLSVLDRELGNLSKGKRLDLEKVVTTLKQDPLVNQTSFSTFLDGLQ